jgi:thioredoxin 1
MTMAGAATELTDANFAEMTGKGVAVVDFWAEWCPPCRMQGPIIEKIAEAYAGRAVVGKLDTDASRNTASSFGVQSIPTIIILKDGQESKRMVGLQTEAKLKEVLDEALGG